MSDLLDRLHEAASSSVLVSAWLLLVAAATGYCIGAINPAAIIAWARRTDLRSIGSGNPGATNAARAFGWKVGVLVGLLDLLKGFVPALALSLMGFHVQALVAGLAAVLGHVTSPLLKGRGGKGVATSLGAILGVHAWWAVPVLVAFGIVLVVTRRVGLASVGACLALVPTAVMLSDDWTDVAFAVALAALVIGRHHRNLRAALTRP